MASEVYDDSKLDGQQSVCIMAEAVMRLLPDNTGIVVKNHGEFYCVSNMVKDGQHHIVLFSLDAPYPQPGTRIRFSGDDPPLPVFDKNEKMN